MDENLDPDLIDDDGPLTPGEIVYVVVLVALGIFALGTVAGFLVARFL